MGGRSRAWSTNLNHVEGVTGVRGGLADMIVAEARNGRPMLLPYEAEREAMAVSLVQRREANPRSRSLSITEAKVKVGKLIDHEEARKVVSRVATRCNDSLGGKAMASCYGGADGVLITLTVDGRKAHGLTVDDKATGPKGNAIPVRFHANKHGHFVHYLNGTKERIERSPWADQVRTK